MSINWKALQQSLEKSQTTDELLTVLFVLATILIDERIAAQKETPDLPDRG